MPSVENVATLKIQLASETERCSKATPLKTLLAGYGHLPSPISCPQSTQPARSPRVRHPRPARAAPVRWRARRSHWYMARAASCQRIARPFSVMRRSRETVDAEGSEQDCDPKASLLSGSFREVISTAGGKPALFAGSATVWRKGPRILQPRQAGIYWRWRGRRRPRIVDRNGGLSY